MNKQIGLFNNRGQGYIAEALFAIIIVSGVLFTASSAFNQPSRLTDAEDKKYLQDIEGDLTGVIDKSIEDGTLKHDILNYNEDFRRYERGDSYQNSEGLYLSYPDSKMGDRLNEFEKRNSREGYTLSAAIEVTPAKNGTQTQSAPNLETQKPEGLPFVSKGSAGQRMVIIKRNIVLHGSDRLQAPVAYYRQDNTQDLNISGQSGMALHEVEADDNFASVIPPARDPSQIGENDIYNTVEIRVVAWF